MNTDVKIEMITSHAVGNSNRFCCGGDNQTKASPKFEVDIVELDRVYFDCSGRNNANNYSQRMRKASEYFA